MMNLLLSCRTSLVVLALLALCVFAAGCGAGANGAPPPRPAESESEDAAAVVEETAEEPSAEAPETADDEWPFPVTEDECARYTAYQTTGPITVDGNLDEPDWQLVPRSPRFRDLVTGEEVVHDTRAALMWDEENLYVGFWIEEPFVTAVHQHRDAPIYTENDIEMFIAGVDTYYEFEMNAYGTIYEGLFIWDDAYEEGGYAEEPTLARDHPQSGAFHGVGFKPHPRGPRLACFGWDFPDLQTGVAVQGTLNNDADRDFGWTAELALPWKSMHWLAVGDGRSLPPTDGDVWRIDFSRFNSYRTAPVPPQEETTECGGWVWSPHGTYDSHVPEVYPFITFSAEPIPAAAPAP